MRSSQSPVRDDATGASSPADEPSAEREATLVDRAGWTRIGRRIVSRVPWLGVVGLIGAAVIWQIIATLIDEEIIIVPPTTVIGNLWQWTVSGDILPHLRASGIEFALGFGIAFVVGTVSGVAIGVNSVVSKTVYPLFQGLNSTPTIALAPLLVIWFGFDLKSKITLIALISFFPILVNVETGVRSVSESHLDVARSFGAGPWEIIRYFRLPSAVPYLLAGSKIAVVSAVTGIFVGELYGASVGIGFTIQNASNTFNTARLLAALVVLAAFGILTSAALGWLAKRLAPWAVGTER